MSTFTLSPSDREKIAAWQKIQDKKVAQVQNTEHPNYGAMGGSYTYSFTGLSTMCIFKVTNSLTKEELDLTNYESCVIM